MTFVGTSITILNKILELGKMEEKNPKICHVIVSKILRTLDQNKKLNFQSQQSFCDNIEFLHTYWYQVY